MIATIEERNRKQRVYRASENGLAVQRRFQVEVDHIFPVGFGWHEPKNLQIIYRSENAIKGTNPNYIPSVIFI